MSHNSTNPIEEAKAYAREAILETYPNLRETDQPAEGSYEYDAIIIRDEDCDVYEIGIMHHDENDTFALVERSRTALRLAEEAEHELAIADLLKSVEVKVMMLLQNCRTEEEAGAAWAAITASTSASARIRIKELGGDVDEVMQKVDHFMLTNPQ